MPFSIAANLRSPLTLLCRKSTEKLIIVVEIISGMQRPYYIKSQGIMDGTYIRVAGTTRHAERYRVQELIMEGTNRSYDQIESEQIVSENEIAAFCEKMYQHAIKLAETDTAREQIQKVGKNQLLSWKLLIERREFAIQPMVIFFWTAIW